jgi:hypothetical protein
MKSGIGTFALCIAATVALLASDGFAREPNSVSLCPPSHRMTEHDGCQPSNGPSSGSVPTHVKNDATEQLWKEIVALINDTLPEVQYCVRGGPLRNGWTLDGAKAEISRCQREVEVSDFIKSAASPELRSCVWAGLLRTRNLTLNEARAESSRCQQIIEKRDHEYQRGREREPGNRTRTTASD